jgi:hypothetical protein
MNTVFGPKTTALVLIDLQILQVLRQIRVEFKNYLVTGTSSKTVRFPSSRYDSAFKAPCNCRKRATNPVQPV